jgi:hypothetical protein
LPLKKSLKFNALRCEKITYFRSFQQTQQTTTIIDKESCISKPDNCKVESHKSLNDKFNPIRLILHALKAHQKSNIKEQDRNK